MGNSNSPPNPMVSSTSPGNIPELDFQTKMALLNLREDSSLIPFNGGLYSNEIVHLIKSRHGLPHSEIPTRKREAVLKLIDLENIPLRRGTVDRRRRDALRRHLQRQRQHHEKQEQRARRMFTVLRRQGHSHSHLHLEKKLDRVVSELEILKEFLSRCDKTLQNCPECVPWEACVESRGEASKCAEAIIKKYPDLIPLSTSTLSAMDVAPPSYLETVRINNNSDARPTKLTVPTRETFVKVPDVTTELDEIEASISV